MLEHSPSLLYLHNISLVEQRCLIKSFQESFNLSLIIFCPWKFLAVALTEWFTNENASGNQQILFLASEDFLSDKSDKLGHIDHKPIVTVFIEVDLFWSWAQAVVEDTRHKFLTIWENALFCVGLTSQQDLINIEQNGKFWFEQGYFPIFNYSLESSPHRLQREQVKLHSERPEIFILPRYLPLTMLTRHFWDLLWESFTYKKHQSIFLCAPERSMIGKVLALEENAHWFKAGLKIVAQGADHFCLLKTPFPQSLQMPGERHFYILGNKRRPYAHQQRFVQAIVSIFHEQKNTKIYVYGWRTREFAAEKGNRQAFYYLCLKFMLKDLWICGKRFLFLNINDFLQ